MESRSTNASGAGEFSMPRFGYSYLASASFLFFFLYVWLRVDPAIEYGHSGPVFLLTRSFFRPYLLYPGGLLDYASAFLGQLNYFGWLGALAYTLVAVLIFLAARWVLLPWTQLGANLVPFLIVFPLLILREQYDNSAVGFAAGFLAALAAALI
ncbi:MAG TPA: DUF6057 family protein, partial [Verrucomicrobiae bacterium]|nr:DUF6057 family protein [Verrucomicrobiae bacterium]